MNGRHWAARSAPIVALDRHFAVVGEDDSGFLASMDLRLSGQLASEEVDGAVGGDKRFRQAEHINQDRAIELLAGRVFVDLVEGE